MLIPTNVFKPEPLKSNLTETDKTKFLGAAQIQPNSVPNILVVDDNPHNLQLLVEILIDMGYQVRPVEEGNLALRSVRQNPPDLILLDILMPELDGYQVCQQLKADANTSHIPIIFISDLNEVIDKVKAFKCGAVDFITKPFQTAEVLVRIENQLRLQEQEKQLRSLAQQEHARATQLAKAILQLKKTQAELTQTRKMLSLGQTVAGMAQEINNPIKFISGTIEHACGYFQDLLSLLHLYQEVYPEPSPKIVKRLEEIELDFIIEDWHNLMTSIQGEPLASVHSFERCGGFTDSMTRNSNRSI